MSENRLQPTGSPSRTGREDNGAAYGRLLRHETGRLPAPAVDVRLDVMAGGIPVGVDWLSGSNWMAVVAVGSVQPPVLRSLSESV
ncbi:hypothetical protein RB614_03040 [Phytohabitans sp. ZYX-F-186]|uniref:Uncharacterized protein n=1 Tax=Phytohabitans maris TaxID=3071409 RepID=A0ABU0Z919_9ACTN|nr:hypothetical protein [Phytohabitans sp. ZYX-F-186]MDQ7903488.1 hypothetical protein [Phytohabitans sp. ZYX-F-186]